MCSINDIPLSNQLLKMTKEGIFPPLSFAKNKRIPLLYALKNLVTNS